MSASTPINNPDDVAAYPVKNKALLTLAVMGASIVQILDSTIANVAIPHMQTSLGATMDTITWVLTSYIVASAVAMPITGWLSDRIGSRNLFLGAVAGFIFASMLCGIATGLTEMVIFRVFQGICAAFIGPLSQTIMLDINKPSEAPRAMAIWGMGIMIAPIMGPMVGGWLTESYNWRWVFYINLPIGIPTLIILWWLLPSRPVVRRELDRFGFAMLAIGLATLQLLLDRGQQEDWLQSWEIIIELLVVIGALWIFAVHQMTTKRPMFERLLLSDRNFFIALNMMLLVGMMMFGIFALLPPMLQNLYGYSVYDTGVLLAPRGVGILLAMFIASRLTGKMDARIIIFSGFVMTALSMWIMTKWSLNMDWHLIVYTGLLQGFGMGFVFIPLNGVAFSTLPMRLRTDGSALLYLFRSLGGSFGISIMTTMLARNMQTSHADLAGHITASSIPTLDLSTTDRLGALGEAGLQLINLEINRQAAMIAYLDDFKIMMFLLILMSPLIFMLKPGKPAPGQQPAMAD
ncbi:MAG TPA: DHA2 family efflux MFS transporter permease subunit [Sphingorhabdus lacus]|mgnify:FL=1|jgi:DHA2 family multidrug resistance protein|uniref:DHA2 family efflux MFS transporter permease subunit n=1 Tax=Sphingorhabdus lacus TaxID=392610 RepID=A0A6I6LCN1_9SPHN|nr:DHA2 family efflux MFS transporter permease subunit [Sphingorhabdus lacus]QGY80063.1 DHA2 family efflux MFS transporter permease subunit [Sphingorhabdus lacus]HNW17292.1 DHA2 family efflux MFS transporter permease subunit [Sphingorhabdus lacus]